MKKTTLTLLTALCASAALAVDYTFSGGTEESPLDFADLNNWSPAATVIDPAVDTLNLTGVATLGSDQTILVRRILFNNSGSLTMNGNNSTAGTSGTPGTQDIAFGTQSTGGAQLYVYGSGNTFNFSVPSMSSKMGAANKVSGDNIIDISSTSSTARNNMTFTSGNFFISLATVANSTASNTIKIGDYSTLTNQASLYLGGNESTAMQSGTVTVEMYGTGSKLDSTGKNVVIGNAHGSGMAGGKTSLKINGTSNEFVSTGATVSIGTSAMTGGTAEFLVGGSNNTVNVQNVAVGNAGSTGGTAQFVMGGSNNLFKATGNVNVANQGLFEIGGDGTHASTVSGDEGKYINGAITVFNGGSFKFTAENSTFNKSGSNINLGNSAADAGVAYMEFSGSNNKITLASTYAFGNSANTNAGAHLYFGGSTNEVTFSGATFNGVKDILEVGGTGNVVTFTGGMTFNNGSSFKALGSGNSVSVNSNLSINGGTLTLNGANKFVAGSAQSTWLNGTTSKLVLVASATGFVDSEGNSNISFVHLRTIEGMLVLDFTDYILQNTADGDHVKLMTNTNDKNGINSIIGSSGTGNFELINAEIGEDGFYWVGNDLYVHIMAIPEPSTFAAIFGALVLALAAYRRRK